MFRWPCAKEKTHTGVAEDVPQKALTKASCTAEHGKPKSRTIDASAPSAIEVGEVTPLFLARFAQKGVRCHSRAWHIKPGMMRWKGQPDAGLCVACNVCAAFA